jgi:beta-phosphoglucomutase
MNVKAIIFDLDGVICHTDQYHFQAWKQLADRLGIPFDERDNDRLRGVSRMDSLNIVLEKSPKVYSTQEKLAFAEEKNEAYKRLLLQITPADLPEETLAALRELRARGLLLGIGSSSKNTKLILSRLGLADFFDAVADGTEITHSKPDPEVFLLAAEKLGVSPAEALVVEDADAGIEAAKAGGFFAAGIGPAAMYSGVDVSLIALTDILVLV